MNEGFALKIDTEPGAKLGSFETEANIGRVVLVSARSREKDPFKSHSLGSCSVAHMYTHALCHTHAHIQPSVPVGTCICTQGTYTWYKNYLSINRSM